jgi:hypothetical protein
MLVTAPSGARPMPTDCPALFFAAISAECRLCRDAIGGAMAGYPTKRIALSIVPLFLYAVLLKT